MSASTTTKYLKSDLKLPLSPCSTVEQVSPMLTGLNPSGDWNDLEDLSFDVEDLLTTSHIQLTMPDLGASENCMSIFFSIYSLYFILL